MVRSRGHVVLLAIAAASCEPSGRTAAPEASRPSAAATLQLAPAIVAPSSDVPVTPPAVPGDEGFAAEPRDESWASRMEAALRQELTEFAEPHTEAKCGPGGRCRVRIRTSAMVGQIAAEARLPGCTREEATPEGETAVYLVNCLEEGPNWAARTERELDRRLAAKARSRGVRVQSVECRSQRCRIVLGFVSFEAARAIDREEFPYGFDFMREFTGGAVSGLEPGRYGRGVFQTIVMNRSTEGGWQTHTSQYEYRIDRETRLARLRAEPRDEQWAPKTEAALRSEYEKELGKGAVVSVECRTKRCELVYRAAAERDARTAATPKDRVAQLRRRHLFLRRDMAGGCSNHAQGPDVTASGEELVVHWFQCAR